MLVFSFLSNAYGTSLCGDWGRVREEWLLKLCPAAATEFVGVGFLVLHLGHSISFGFKGDLQPPQNFIVVGISAPHFGHLTLAVGTKLAPQFPQNLISKGFRHPQL